MRSKTLSCLYTVCTTLMLLRSVFEWVEHGIDIARVRGAMSTGAIYEKITKKTMHALMVQLDKIVHQIASVMLCYDLCGLCYYYGWTNDQADYAVTPLP